MSMRLIIAIFAGIFLALVGIVLVGGGVITMKLRDPREIAVLATFLLAVGLELFVLWKLKGD